MTHTRCKTWHIHGTQTLHAVQCPYLLGCSPSLRPWSQKYCFQQQKSLLFYSYLLGVISTKWLGLVGR